MKIFRLFGVAVASLCMCVNFTACSSGDDANGGGFASERKLVKMVLQLDDGTETHEFSYDNQGRVTEIKIDDEDDVWSHLFYWEDNSVRIMQDDGEHRGTYTIENGLVRSKYTPGDGHEEGCTDYYIYNIADKLTRISCHTYTELTTELIWDDDKLISYVGTYDFCSTYTYGNITCKKGYYPLFELTDLTFTNPELVGMKTNQLPISCKYTPKVQAEEFTETYEYEFDSEGYISKIIVTRGSGGTRSCTLTWE